jgi:hypothetical protein
MRDPVRPLVIGLAIAVASAQAGDEPPPAFKASTLLAPEIVRGANYEVSEDVRTDDFFHEFTLSSSFGSFTAAGRSQLSVRIQEIDAIAALQEVSKTKVFLEAAGQSVVNVGQGAVALVKDPVESAKGLGAGIKRFGVNLGRRTQRAVESAGDDTSPDGAPEKDSAATSAARGVLGVTPAMRRWASKVGVDPYTTNAVLQEALASIAKVDAAGSIATKVAVPIPAAVGLTSKAGHLVWDKDPEEVRKINERRLRELTVSDEVAKALFTNQWFTLTYQTRFIAALHAVRAAGSADYVHTAAEARSEREALFFVESAELLEDWHAREPVAGILTDSRALVARNRRERATALLPLDYVRWTAATERAVREIGDRARQELAATQLQIVLTGRASSRAGRELAGLGWTLVKAPARAPA